MADEPSWEDIFVAPSQQTPPSDAASSPAAQDEAPLTRKEAREQEGGKRRGKGDRPVQSAIARPKKKRRLGWLWALLVVILLGASTVAVVWWAFEDQVRDILGWQLPTDYTGTGNGEEVNVTVAAGDVGDDIAQSLADAGVTMTFDAFHDLLVAETEPSVFQPGTYALEKEMSAASARDGLLDAENRVESTVLIPEGTTLAGVISRVAKGTGIPEADLKKAVKDPTDYNVSSKAPSLEGYLFPATYTFPPGSTAEEVIQTMVDRMNVALNDAGVSKSDRLEVLTLASIIQKEGGNTADFYKVSRVFTNRLQQDMRLQSDATVSYGTGNTSIHTTKAERADASNKYNTYANDGLPVGPISAPGDDAIDAALNPAKGKWLYFVLVDGETGETTFSNTLAEHEAAVKIWQAWYAAHPDWDN